MKNSLLLLLIAMVGSLPGEEPSYETLINATIQACDEPAILLSDSFTNRIAVYKAACTNVQGRCAADLSLAISLMHRMDCDEKCVGNDDCYNLHQALVSNIFYSADLDYASWIRYAAAAEYMGGLNFDSCDDAAFSLSTNMIARTAVCPPEMGQTNFWNAMSRWMGCSNETFSTAYRLNAAIWLAEHGRQAEMGSYTNAMPTSAIKLLLDEIR